MRFDDLLAPIARDAFVRDYWGHKPLFIEGPADKFAALFSPEALTRVVRAQRGRGPVPCPSVYLPDRGWETRVVAEHGFRPDIALSPEDAESMLEASGTVKVRHVERAWRPIAELVSTVSSDLGFVGEVFCDCWRSTPGAGASPHFDGGYNISIQLAGRKRWTVSRKPALPWPGRYAPRGADGKPVYHDRTQRVTLAPWAYDVAPVDSDPLEVTATAGDVLLLPPGTWHQTHVEGDDASLSLTLVLNPLPVFQLLSRVLADRMMARQQWRSLPLIGSEDLKQFMRARLDELADDLRTEQVAQVLKQSLDQL